MKVLIVASESHPFIKTGGLGDVIGALPKELKKLGIDVRVIIPKYKNIKEELTKDLKFLKAFNVQVGWRNQYCGILESIYEDVPYYLLDNEYYFKRDGLYGYYDDGERFAYFNRAVLEAIRQLNWKPDIIHCNDWQAGMIPVLNKVEYSHNDFYSGIKSIISIHNLLFRGTFSKEILPDLFGYDYELFDNGSMELYGGASFLKGAINYSDMITTVSKSYAEEIKTPQYGELLDGLLRWKQGSLKGIVNGIDYDEYNPETDNYIFKNYSIDNIDNKKINKTKLQKELGLEVSEDIPMIGIVSRLTNQKGLDLIMCSLEEVLEKDIQLVVLGTGDYNYEEGFKYFAERYPNKVSANILFDNKLAHKIYAASDLFLMPSAFEPCGLGQLIALRYGTVPIVRETGGLKDTVTPYNEYTREGTGFGFRGYDRYEIINCINYALKIYEDKDRFREIVVQAMEKDNSWIKSAKEYKKMYESLL